MADNSDINLPLTDDGTGYRKEAVTAYLKQISDHFNARVNDAKSDTRGDTEKMLSNANVIGEQFINEAKEKANKLIQDAQNKASGILAKANQEAGNNIEGALTKVHALVKSAQDKLGDAEVKAADLEKESTEKAAKLHKDAVKHIAGLEQEAQENHERVIGLSRDLENSVERDRVAAMSEIESLRQEALEAHATALADVEKLKTDATIQHIDALAGVGKLVNDADAYARETQDEADINARITKEDAEKDAYVIRSNAKEYAKKHIAETEDVAQKIRDDADEFSLESRVSAKRLLNDSKTHAETMIVQAQEESARLLEDADTYCDSRLEELSNALYEGQTKIELFQSHYDDSVTRLTALYESKLADMKSFSRIDFGSIDTTVKAKPKKNNVTVTESNGNTFDSADDLIDSSTVSNSNENVVVEDTVAEEADMTDNIPMAVSDSDSEKVNKVQVVFPTDDENIINLADFDEDK